MKKNRLIILIILIAMVGAGATFFLFYKQAGESEYQDQTSESVCQDFIKECCNKQWSYRAGGGMMVYETHDDLRTNIDDECEEACPADCSRYTEERGYFKDKKKQQEYYGNAFKECENKYKECIEEGDCKGCDKYGQPIHLWD